MDNRRQPITFGLGDPMLPCPVCGWVGDGLREAELWRHLAGAHAREIEQAQDEVERLRAGRES